MKKILILIILCFSFLFVGCEKAEKELELQRLDSQITEKQQELNYYNKLLTDAKEQKEASGIVVERYILTIKVKQSHFSLDLGKHIKDELNATEFEIAVDEQYYNSVNIGDSICNEFRSGSFLMKGSIGSWDLSVQNKRIEKV